ncbi:MAG TPA: 2-dehydropantoate 2-reductase N-terminal domain-containing protein [Bordetella sp.]|jgi:2-dehydropantoate 2-reductase|nr:2-dehydropantoate 2-reductase N-terminal domain-containing protein [Bordetella sp.]
MTLRVALYGAGAIGSHLAWRLARAGARVCAVARGRRLQAIRGDGIRIETAGTVSALPVTAEEDPSRLGPQDVVVIAVKERDLGSVAAGMAPLLRPDTAIVSVQNGIPWWYFGQRSGRACLDLPARHPAALALEQVVGPRPLFGAVVSSPSTLRASGVVELDGARHTIRLGITVPDQSRTAADMLVRLWSTGGMDAATSEDVREQVWEKLVRNACTGLIALLTNSAPATALADPVLHRLSCAIAHEIAATAKAYGYSPDPNSSSLATARALGHLPSLVQDFRAGRTPDLACQFIMPLEMARQAGVAVPQLEQLAALARGLLANMTYST